MKQVIRLLSVTIKLFGLVSLTYIPVVQAEKNKTIFIKSTVTGSHEQPTVSYIIPWQSAAKTEAFQIHLGPSFLANTFEHISLSELEHELVLREQIQTAFDAKQAAPAGSTVLP